MPWWMEMQIRRGEGFPGDQGTPVRGGGGTGDLERSIGSGGESVDDLRGGLPDPG